MIEKIEAIRSLVGGAITQKYNGEIIYHDDQTPPTNEEIQVKQTEIQSAEPMRLLREERNRRLQETDWWASSDLLISDDQRKYRQALRDITKTANPQLNEFDELINVTWPEKP